MQNIILILNSILILLGILLIVFGCLIYFKKKYHLINNFKHNKKIGKYTDDYALRIGLIEFYCGIIFISIGIVSFIINQKIFSIISLTTSIAFLIIGLAINSIKSKTKIDL